jgi:O-methyltransferase
MTAHPMSTIILEMIEERRQFLKQAFLTLTVSEVGGDYVEFGSWGAQSLKSAYEITQIVCPERHLWAFDSFVGERPPSTDEIDRRPALESYRNEGPSGVEAFYAICEEQGVPRDAFTPVAGYFEETLPPLGDDAPPSDIALAYVDCNLYTSTVCVLDFLKPRLKHGMIVAFDDYWVYKPTHVSGERLALHHFLEANPSWRFVPYRELHHVGQAYVVESADALEYVVG